MALPDLTVRIGGDASGLSSALDEAGKLASSFASNLAEGIAGGFGADIGAMLLNQLSGGALDKVKSFISSEISSAFSSVDFGGLTSKVEGLFSSLTSSAGGLASKLKGVFSDISANFDLSGLKNAFGGVAESAENAFSGARAAAADAFAGIGEAASGAAEYASTALAGIGDVISGVTSAASTAASAAGLAGRAVTFVSEASAAASEALGVASEAVVAGWEAAGAAVGSTAIAAGLAGIAIGAGVALAAMTALVEATDAEITAQAILAAQSETTFQNVATYQGAGQTLGVGNTLSTLFGGGKLEADIAMLQQLAQSSSAVGQAIAGVFANPATSSGIEAIVAAFQALPDPIDRANLAVKLFGSDAAAGLALMNDQTVEAVNNAFDMAAGWDQSTRESLQRITDFVSSVKGWWADDQWITKLSDDFKQAFILSITATETAFHDFITGFSQEGGWAGIWDAEVQSAKDAISTTSSLWDAFWSGGLDVAAANAVNSIQNSLQSLWNDIQNAGQSTIGYGPWQYFSQAASDAITMAQGAVGDFEQWLAGSAQSTFSAVWQQYLAVADPAINTVSGLWSDFTGNVDAAATTFQGIWQAFSDAATSVLGKSDINSLTFGDAWAAVSGTFESIWNTFSQAATDALGSVEAAAGSAFGSINTAIGDFIGHNIWDPFAQNAALAFANIESNVNGAFSDIVAGAEAAFPGLWDSLNTGAQQAAAHLPAVFQTAFDKLGANAKSAMETVNGWLQMIGVMPGGAPNLSNAQLADYLKQFLGGATTPGGPLSVPTVAQAGVVQQALAVIAANKSTSESYEQLTSDVSSLTAKLGELTAKWKLDPGNAFLAQAIVSTQALINQDDALIAKTDALEASVTNLAKAYATLGVQNPALQTNALNTALTDFIALAPNLPLPEMEQAATDLAAKFQTAFNNGVIGADKFYAALHAINNILDTATGKMGSFDALLGKFQEYSEDLTLPDLANLKVGITDPSALSGLQAVETSLYQVQAAAIAADVAAEQLANPGITQLNALLDQESISAGSVSGSLAGVTQASNDAATAMQTLVAAVPGAQIVAPWIAVQQAIQGATDKVYAEATAENNAYLQEMAAWQAYWDSMDQGWSVVAQTAQTAIGQIEQALSKDLATGIIDAITGTKNLTQAFITMGEQIAKTVLTTIIQGALTPLFNMLDGGSSGSGGLIGQIPILGNLITYGKLSNPNPLPTGNQITGPLGHGTPNPDYVASPGEVAGSQGEGGYLGSGGPAGPLTEDEDYSGIPEETTNEMEQGGTFSGTQVNAGDAGLGDLDDATQETTDDLDDLNSGITDSTGDVGDMSDAFKGTTSNVGDFSDGISDSTGNVGDLSDAFSGAGDDVGTFSTGLTGASSDLSSFGSDLAAAAPDLASIGSGAGDVADSVGDASDAAGDASDAAGDASDAAGDAASAAGDAASGLTGILGAVGSIGSFITGAIGDIEQSTGNNTLWLIASSSQGCENQLIDLQQSANQYWPNLVHLVDIWGAINSLDTDMGMDVGALTDALNFQLSALGTTVNANLVAIIQAIRTSVSIGGSQQTSSLLLKAGVLPGAVTDGSTSDPNLPANTAALNSESQALSLLASAVSADSTAIQANTASLGAAGSSASSTQAIAQLDADLSGKLQQMGVSLTSLLADGDSTVSQLKTANDALKELVDYAKKRLALIGGGGSDSGTACCCDESSSGAGSAAQPATQTPAQALQQAAAPLIQALNTVTQACVPIPPALEAVPPALEATTTKIGDIDGDMVVLGTTVRTASGDIVSSSASNTGALNWTAGALVNQTTATGALTTATDEDVTATDGLGTDFTGLESDISALGSDINSAASKSGASTPPVNDGDTSDLVGGNVNLPYTPPVNDGDYSGLVGGGDFSGASYQPPSSYQPIDSSLQPLSSSVQQVTSNLSALSSAVSTVTDAATPAAVSISRLGVETSSLNNRVGGGVAASAVPAAPVKVGGTETAAPIGQFGTATTFSGNPLGVSVSPSLPVNYGASAPGDTAVSAPQPLANQPNAYTSGPSQPADFIGNSVGGVNIPVTTYAGNFQVNGTGTESSGSEVAYPTSAQNWNVPGEAPVVSGAEQLGASFAPTDTDTAPPANNPGPIDSSGPSPVPAANAIPVGTTPAGLGLPTSSAITTPVTPAATTAALPAASSGSPTPVYDSQVWGVVGTVFSAVKQLDSDLTGSLETQISALNQNLIQISENLSTFANAETKNTQQIDKDLVAFATDETQNTSSIDSDLKQFSQAETKNTSQIDTDLGTGFRSVVTAIQALSLSVGSSGGGGGGASDYTQSAAGGTQDGGTYPLLPDAPDTFNSSGEYGSNNGMGGTPGGLATGVGNEPNPYGVVPPDFGPSDFTGMTGLASLSQAVTSSSSPSLTTSSPNAQKVQVTVIAANPGSRATGQALVSSIRNLGVKI